MKTGTPSTLEWHKRYDNIDGTGEMLMGLMLLGFGLLGYLQTILPKDSIWRTNGFCSLLFMYAVLIGVLGPGYWVRSLIKRRLTFPRTGYVALGVGAHHDGGGIGGLGVKVKKSYWAVMVGGAVIAAVIVAGLACLVAFERRHLDAMMWLVGVGYVGYLGFWVLVYAFWIWRMGREHRWKWLMLLLMALGLFVIGLLGPGNFIEVARPVSLFVGLVWVISGVATLCSYLRHTRPPDLEPE
jgi:hypothetical protein